MEFSSQMHQNWDVLKGRHRGVEVWFFVWVFFFLLTLFFLWLTVPWEWWGRKQKIRLNWETSFHLKVSLLCEKYTLKYSVQNFESSHIEEKDAHLQYCSVPFRSCWFQFWPGNGFILAAGGVILCIISITFLKKTNKNWQMWSNWP